MRSLEYLKPFHEDTVLMEIQFAFESTIPEGELTPKAVGNWNTLKHVFPPPSTIIIAYHSLTVEPTYQYTMGTPAVEVQGPNK